MNSPLTNHLILVNLELIFKSENQCLHKDDFIDLNQKRISDSSELIAYLLDKNLIEIEEDASVFYLTTEGYEAHESWHWYDPTLDFEEDDFYEEELDVDELFRYTDFEREQMRSFKDLKSVYPKRRRFIRSNEFFILLFLGAITAIYLPARKNKNRPNLEFLNSEKLRIIIDSANESKQKPVFIFNEDKRSKTKDKRSKTKDFLSNF